ncbi:hypothetical protein TWF696_004569 [Orbilia brochopaga]|uniref:DUF7918 domain-containing protein n=1 Tax=Orbilia brochopaga TaxID=3140254 RepID=A0AAV9V931_9PEZI
MPQHRNISCHLYIGDTKAMEYNVHNVDNRSTAHIVSEEGQTFSFKIEAGTALMSAARLDLELWADGYKLDCFTFTESVYEVDDAQVRDQVTGAIKIVKLRFAKLNTVDQGPSNADDAEAEQLKRLGTLEIKLWRSESNVSQSTTFPYADCPLQTPIHEKKIKGQSVSHVTSLESKGTVAQQSSWGYITTKIDPYDRPWVAFVFKHASKALLQSEGIVPKDEVKEKGAAVASAKGKKAQSSRAKVNDTKNEESKVEDVKFDDDVAAMSQPQLRQEIMRLRKRPGDSLDQSVVKARRTMKCVRTPDADNLLSTAEKGDKRK